jgi:YkgG family uncharacterized protein
MTMPEVESAETHALLSASVRPEPPAVPEKYGRLADPLRVASVAKNLEANGFRTIVVASSDEARKTVGALLPEGADVFDSASATLDETGIGPMIRDSGHYRPIRPTLMQLAGEGKNSEARRLGAAPDYIVGSVHAVTERGQVVIASGSGSQLAPYVFGAGHVIWVVGAQKIVSDLDEAFDRINTYTLPKESERVRKVYGYPGSLVGKLLVVNRELQPDRITIVIVNERLGF